MREFKCVNFTTQTVSFIVYATLFQQNCLANELKLLRILNTTLSLEL